MLHKNTILVNPSIYKDIEKANCIDLNNSFSKENIEKCIGYKRGEYNKNTQCLKEVIGVFHGFNNENVIVTSSGVCLATMISISNQFNNIWYYKETYPEMKDAYNALGKAHELSNFEDISENDIVCIETHCIPECIDNRDIIAGIVEYTHSKKAFVLVDNSHLSMNYNPFEDFDIDFVLISMSKHSIGFNNSLVGALICKDNAVVKEKFAKIRAIKGRLGFQIHPLDCYFCLLGLQTLPLRMEKVKENEVYFKNFLQLNKIRYNCINGAGIFFIYTDENFDPDELYKIKLFTIADTFGVNFSVFKHWEKFGYIRVSLGIEDKEDIINAFKTLISYIKAHQ